MSARWFRVYDDLVDDPKVQMLPDRLFRALINLWCLASRNGGILPPLEQIAFSLRLKPDKAHALLGELRLAGLLDDDDDGTGKVRPHNWQGRQFQSDVSTERVKRHRERKRGVSGNSGETLHGTAPDTEAETEKEKTSLRSVQKPAKGTRLAADWSLSPEGREYARSQGLSDHDIAREAEKFRDWWLAQPGQKGVKLDWEATWRTWVRNACERLGIAPKPGGNGSKRVELNAHGDVVDWDARLAFAQKHGRWMEEIWGSQDHIPPDYRDRFADALQRH